MGNGSCKHKVLMGSGPLNGVADLVLMGQPMPGLSPSMLFGANGLHWTSAVVFEEKGVRFLYPVFFGL